MYALLLMDHTIKKREYITIMFTQNIIGRERYADDIANYKLTVKDFNYLLALPSQVDVIAT